MHSYIRSLLGFRKVILRETPRPVTPFGGLFVLIEFLQRIRYAEAVSAVLPFRLRSPNAIDPLDTFTAFLFSVTAGARRFAHANLLRADRALHQLLGIRRFPIDDTIRNFFRRFRMGEVQRFFEPLWKWQLARVPKRAEGYSLDMDSTVFERYGRQEGARKGYNPRKPGRRSHHPLLAVLAEVQLVVQGWLRSGNTGSAQGSVAFLQEVLSLLPAWVRLRCLRADSGFFDDKLLCFLEERHLPYLIVARLTPWLKRAVAGIQNWIAIDPDYSVGEIHLQLFGWNRERRFIVVRERIREGKDPVGRKLIDVPGYAFRVLVTNRSEAPLELWRDYNLRATTEERIKELKYDLAADDFCLHEFYATEAAFRSVLFLFNLLSEFQRAVGYGTYRQPATLRAEVFLCGAILGRSGRHHVLHLSMSWGGLQQRNALIRALLHYHPPTSPKLKTDHENSGEIPMPN